MVGLSLPIRISREADMSSIGRDWFSCVGLGRTARFFAVASMAAMLAACAQTSVVGQKPVSLASREASPPETDRKASIVAHRQVAVVKRKEPSSATERPPADIQKPSDGLASFYSHSSQTASGEKFDARELTAAHRTLPFGTRVRVTNVATGKAVTVRINDRGPFIRGRVVDVSHAAAESLGMVGQGVTKVKLDVVQ